MRIVVVAYFIAIMSCMTNFSFGQNVIPIEKEIHLSILDNQVENADSLTLMFNELKHKTICFIYYRKDQSGNYWLVQKTDYIRVDASNGEVKIPVAFPKHMIKKAKETNNFVYKVKLFYDLKRIEHDFKVIIDSRPT